MSMAILRVLIILALTLAACRPEAPPGAGEYCEAQSDCATGLRCILEPLGEFGMEQFANECAIACDPTVGDKECRFAGDSGACPNCVLVQGSHEGVCIFGFCPID